MPNLDPQVLASAFGELNTTEVSQIEEVMLQRALKQEDDRKRAAEELKGALNEKGALIAKRALKYLARACLCSKGRALKSNIFIAEYTLF